VTSESLRRSRPGLLTPLETGSFESSGKPGRVLIKNYRIAFIAKTCDRHYPKVGYP
jgi:hypothetical protein